MLHLCRCCASAGIFDLCVEQQRALSDSDEGSEDESKKVKVKVDLNEDHSKLVQMKHVSRLSTSTNVLQNSPLVLFSS